MLFFYGREENKMVLIKNISCDARVNVALRPTVKEMAVTSNMSEKRERTLYNMFYDHGPGRGTMLSLPFDQLIEHGIGHLFYWERSADPRAVIDLANKGPFSALVLSIGQAEKYRGLINNIPLIVKLDGHFSVGKQVENDRHSTLSSIERALNAKADAVGFTFYIGGKETEQDAERCSELTWQAHKADLPVFMWAYARGPLPELTGTDNLYWCAQGISIGESIGVDIVKQKFHMPPKEEKRKAYFESLQKGGYFQKMMPDVGKLLELEPENPEDVPYDLHVKRLAFMAAVAPNTLKIISGGPKTDNEEGLLKILKAVMDSGNEGQIVGRNLWGRPVEEALALSKRMADLMRSPEYARK